MYSGGCQCGGLRYRVKGELEHAHICHCRMCQKATGNYFMPLARTKAAELSITRGEPSWYWSSATARRGFCSKCGTPLFFDLPEYGVISIVLGSLDDPNVVKLEFQCGTESRIDGLDDLPVLPDVPASGKWYAKIAQAAFQHPDHDTSEWVPRTG